MAELELPKSKRTEIIEFLTRVTNGTKEGYDSIKDNQLYAIYKHVTEERNRYIREIREFEAKQQIDITEIEHFNKFNNKELREIGEEYGIYEPEMPKKQFESSKKINFDRDIECVERRIEEVRTMFGFDADLMSDEELYENGIILEYSSYSRKYSEEKVNLIRAMIKIIVQSRLLNNELEPYNETSLEYYSYEQIRELYEKTRDLNPTIMQLHELELIYKPKSGK